MYSMDHIGLGTCDLDFALDHFSGCLPEEAKIKNLLNKLCSAVLSCDLKYRDAFYDTWTTIQRCAAVCPSTVADVLAYASSATEQCNAREMFAAILESIYTMTGEVTMPEKPAWGSVGTQLALLRLLPRLLLRIRRRWCLFLSDYLELLLHWVTTVLPCLPWDEPILDLARIHLQPGGGDTGMTQTQPGISKAQGSLTRGPLASSKNNCNVLATGRLGAARQRQLVPDSGDMTVPFSSQTSGAVGEARDESCASAGVVSVVEEVAQDLAALAQFVLCEHPQRGRPDGSAGDCAAQPQERCPAAVQLTVTDPSHVQSTGVGGPEVPLPPPPHCPVEPTQVHAGAPVNSARAGGDLGAGLRQAHLSAQEAQQGAQLLLQAGCQLSGLVVQSPACQLAAQRSMAAALLDTGGGAPGRQLQRMGPWAAASQLAPVVSLLSPVLSMLSLQAQHGPPPTASHLWEAAEAWAEAAQREADAGGCSCDEGGEDHDQGWQDFLLIKAGAALGWCAAVVGSRSSGKRDLRHSRGADAGPPCPVNFNLQAPTRLLQSLQQLLPVVQALLDWGAQHESVPLVVLPMYCLTQACWHASPSPASHPSCKASGVPTSGVAHSRAEPEEMAHPMVVEDAAARLVSTLFMTMSFNPVEAVRSCAYQSVQAVLDCTPPQARLGVLLGMLQMESSAAVVVALQRIRQDMASELESEACHCYYFYSPAVVEAAIHRFRKGREVLQRSNAEDMLSEVDTMEAALALLRFVLLRQAALGAGHVHQRNASSNRTKDPRNVGTEEGSGGASRAAVCTPPELLSKQNVQSMLERDILPLQATLQDELRAHGKPGHFCAQPCPGTPVCNDAAVRPCLHLQLQDNLNGSLQGDSSGGLQEWLGLQRVLDVVDRVVEIAKQL